MKIQFTLNSTGAHSQAAHKAILRRVHATKAGTHRYERRKVRESLRRTAAFDDETGFSLR